MEQNNAVSPVPGQQKEETGEVLMNFPDAMREILNGSHVMRKAWMEKAPMFCGLNETFLSIFRVKDGETQPRWHQWLVNDGDMSGIDWIVIPKETQTVEA